MNQLNELKEKWGQVLQSLKERKTSLLLLAGTIAVLLILFSECSGENNDEQVIVKSDLDFSIESYVAQLEQEICEVVELIDGPGEAKVMITPATSIEYVFFQEEKLNTDQQEETSASGKKQTVRSDKETKVSIVDGDNGNEALITTALMPEIGGVVVICEGGGNVLVQERVTAAVSVALNIPQNRVYVAKKQA